MALTYIALGRDVFREELFTWLTWSFAAGITVRSAEIAYDFAKSSYLLHRDNVQRIGELTNALTAVEARQLAPSPKAIEPKPNPNLVYLKEEIANAHVDIFGIFLKHRQTQHVTGFERDVLALYAVINNKPLPPPNKVRGVGGVSARIVYTDSGDASPVEISRGAWQLQQDNRVNFAVSDTQRLVMAVAYLEDNAIRVDAVYREFDDSNGRFTTGYEELQGDLYGVHIQLVGETTGEVFKELELKLTISKEPRFSFKLEEISLANQELEKRERIITQLGEFLNEGGRILRGLEEHRVREPYTTKADEWEQKVVAFFNENRMKSYALRFGNKAVMHKYKGTVTPNTEILFDFLHTRIIRLDEFIKELSKD
jgi:hypothetical protein